MRIRTKLILLFLAVSLIPVLGLSWLAVETAGNALRDSIGESFSKIASEKARTIDEIFQAKIFEAQVLANHPVIQAAVREANRRFFGMDRVNREDKAWITAKGKTALAEKILANATSDFLRSYQEREPQNYGELFVTGLHGENVGMTGVLTDYYQADEAWWKSGFNAGRGDTFIDDRGYDESVGAIVAGVVVPVLDGDKAIGVLKINFRISDIIDVIAGDAVQVGEDVTLAREVGSVILSAGKGDKKELSGVEKGVLGTTDSGWSVDRHKGVPSILGYAALPTPIYSRGLPRGALKGAAGEVWRLSIWYVFVEMEQGVALEPVNSLRSQLALGSVIIGLIGVLLAALFATTMSRPLQELADGMEQVAKGDLRHKVGTDRHDEIGALATSFDAMTAKLQETLASRDILNLEVRERKRAEAELKERTAELERSNDELQQFAYVASHDLQEPLRMVVNYNQLLARRYQGKLDEEADEFIAFAVDGAKRMQVLIKDLLDYSRVETKAGVPVATDLGPVMEDALLNLKMATEETGAKVTVGAMPTVMADERQIVRLFQNLVGNALKYRHPDRSPEIAITAEAKGKMWEIAVRDNGLGIEKKFFERIFMVFQRLHPQGQYEGTGIGLAICKKIAERHGGGIRVESVPGEGSTFFVTLPGA